MCEVYEFVNDTTKDLGIVFVKAGAKTPLQKVIGGESTIEIYKEGQGILMIHDIDGLEHKYQFPGSVKRVEVKIGEKMQWEAITDLVFHELCFPPYADGRFEVVE